MLRHLEDLEKLLQVAEEVSGEDLFEKERGDLVSPYRKFIRTEEIFTRHAPFSSSAKIESRGYFMNDTFIIAVPAGPGSPYSIGSSLLTEGSVNDKRKTLKLFTGKYRVIHWFDLHNIIIKMVKDHGTGNQGVQLTNITREHDTEQGNRVLTRVTKVELWFHDDDLAQQIYTDMSVCIGELIDADYHRNDNDGASVGSRQSLAHSEVSGGSASEEGGLERTRSWASRKNNLRRNGTLNNRKENLRNSVRARSVGSATDSESVGGLSLADLESRYKLDLEAPSLPDGSVDYLVEFGEGPMGFSLSSGKGVGVIVGRIAEGSFSETAGVCIGDRVMQVANQEITKETAWQDVVGMIKKNQRPLRIKFERIAGRHVYDDVASEGPKLKRFSLTKQSSPQSESTRKRAWAAKRAQQAHTMVSNFDNRLISLQELERHYKNQQSSTETSIVDTINLLFVNIKERDRSDANVQSCNVLQEIWTTERSYVADLRRLIGQFIIEIRRKTRKRKCRDNLEGSRVCEHNSRRTKCTKTSNEVECIMDNEDIHEVFGNVETLIQINNELLEHLEEELKKRASLKDVSAANLAEIYGPAFKRIMPFFKLYAVYCHQYPLAISKLTEIRAENPDLNAFLREREKKAGTSLSSLLIKPVQRICKYPLLFRELLKHMSSIPGVESHKIEIQTTYNVVQQIAGDVNGIVAEKENNESLLDVYEELGGEASVPWLITPSRKFVTKLQVLVAESPYNVEPKLHVLYVCNDLIMLGKGKDINRFGTLNKTGGKKGTARALSLRRKFGKSLRRSMSHSSNTLDMQKASKMTLGGTAVKIIKMMDLKDVKITDYNQVNGDGHSCLELKLTERTKEGTKVNTLISKIRIWTRTKDERDGLFSDIEENIERLANARQGHQMALEENKVFTKRSWKQRKSRT